MTRFLFKALTVIAAVIILAFSLEQLISWQLNSGKRYYFQADWHDLKGHQSQILFVGNSRTWVQVDPFEIQKQFKTSIEIIAQDGQDIHFMWLKFKQYMRGNQCPKEIYLQVDPYFLFERTDLYGFDNFRTVFYHDRANLSSLEKRQGYNTLYRYLPLYAININLLAKVLLNKTVPENETFAKSHGFMKLSMPWSAGVWQHPDSTRLNPDNISTYLDSFFVFAKKENCKLYAIYPPQSAPSFHTISHYNTIPEKVSSLSTKYNYPCTYLNFNSDSLYNDSTLFYNHMHLNNRGVDVFMKQLINEQRAFAGFRK